ncbi:WD40 repeat domain-containing protein [Streptomyces buecherae]|uniref:WD40 repeat domain-containing protein n=1 Tax=Streptomyces buecherae TaxID=2763006 RepID=A0A7H8NC99_9ACTN|nr:WD40 repeat domain-containing protein [Streptomyces buecherae]QKW51398.1 WD40 repeat domain-containing protein [Streptomyces buecherae]
MNTPNNTEFTAELHRFAEDLRRLRVDRGSPTLSKIVSRAAAVPGTSCLSVSALSEAFSGKRLQRVDTLMSLVHTLLSYDEDGKSRCVTRRAPEMEVWRKRWRDLDQLRSLCRRTVTRTVAEAPTHAVSPLALRVLADNLVHGYAVSLTPFEGPADSYDASAFSPDGRYLALGGSDGAVYLQDPVTGKAVTGPLAGHQGIVRGLAFSPDGRLLASAADDGTVWLWDVSFRRPVGGSLPDSEGVPDSVGFSPDGKLLAAGGYVGCVYLWDTATREMIRALNIGSSRLDALAFSPDGTLLAAAGSDGSVRLWSPATWEVTGDIAVGGCCDIAFSPDGKLLASAGADGSVRLWDPLAPGTAVRDMSSAPAEAVSAVAFSPDGRLLAGAVMDGTVHLWNPANGQPLSDPLDTPLGEVYAVAFSPDGGLIAAVGHNCTVQMWITPVLRAN